MLFYLVVIYSNEVDCWKFLRCEFLYLNFYFIVIVDYFQQACLMVSSYFAESYPAESYIV